MVMAGAALILALLAPFGMDAMPFGPRLAIWMLFAVGGYLCFRPVIGGAIALSERSGAPLWLCLILAVLLASLPTTLIVVWGLYGDQFGALRLGQLGQHYLQVVLVGGLVTAVQLVARWRQGAGAEPTPAPAPASEPPLSTEVSPTPAALLLDKLPPGIGHEIRYLENEDHYIRVHTTRGNALVLMRMGDALSALAGLDGLRVHRSYWVARAAVTGTKKRDRALILLLGDDTEIPVARNMVATLKEKGWLN